jgi:TatD DNase family protein
VYINAHTHARIHDARIEVVNLEAGTSDRTEHYSYGIHPWNVSAETQEDELLLLKAAVHEKRCIAVGECGIDKLCSVGVELQTEVFGRQIEIANDVNKPLIIHCVKAFNELINCLNLHENKVPVIIHGFNNNENIANLLLNQGCYLSFGKALLGYESNAAKALKQAGRRKFLLETDDADISIKYIYRKAAELLGVDEDILMQQMMINFEAIFGIKP